MSEALVLALPNFSHPFILETNASNGELVLFLCKGGQPITYLSQALAPKHVALSIYDKIGCVDSYCEMTA